MRISFCPVSCQKFLQENWSQIYPVNDASGNENGDELNEENDQELFVSVISLSTEKLLHAKTKTALLCGAIMCASMASGNQEVNGFALTARETV